MRNSSARRGLQLRSRCGIAWTKAANLLLAGLEIAFSDKTSRPLLFPPIFLIGPPRCGSTLIYQCLLHRFEMAYISNLHQKYCGSPAIIERLCHYAEQQQTGTFESDYGRTPGWAGPSEGWRFWYRFFRRVPQFVGRADADPRKMVRLRGAVRSLGNAAKCPILFKNLPCALRLEPLGNALPEALYLVVCREKIPMARSILAGRMKANGTYDQWWSVEPPGLEELRKRPPPEQVVGQIEQIYACIETGRKQIGRDRFCNVSYGEFCRDVTGSVERIRKFVASHGILLAEQGDLPVAFPARPPATIDPALAQQLHEYCAQRDSASYPSSS